MIYLNIGSNLRSSYGNKEDNINEALRLIKKNDIKILKKSKLFLSPSYPNNKLPKFLNICVKIKCDYNPIKLLKILKKIETKMGRRNKTKNSPRVCDIDIIDYQNIIIEQKNLKTPHPRMHKRNFVLFPLMEICPTWIHPVFNKKINCLIDELSLKSRLEITRLRKSAII